MKIDFLSWTCTAWLLLTVSAGAFEVTKNVNTGKPPTEKAVIFEKGQSPDLLTFFDNENCRMSYNADGAIEARISGSGEVKCGVKWQPKGELKGTFDTKDYAYVVLTCRIEGSNKTTNPNGQVTEQRPDNLWFPAVLFNDKGETVGSANLADGSPDGTTPAQTVAIVLPMLLFNYWGDHDSSAVSGIGFTWAKTRPNVSRDYRLVIDRITLAN